MPRILRRLALLGDATGESPRLRTRVPRRHRRRFLHARPDRRRESGRLPRAGGVEGLHLPRGREGRQGVAARAAQAVGESRVLRGGRLGEASREVHGG